MSLFFARFFCAVDSISLIRLSWLTSDAPGATTISEIKDNTVNTYTVTPEQFGFETVELKELQGGDGKVNAQITKDILSGKEKGAKRNIVLLNAGATLYAGGMCSSIEEGIKLAEKTIDSGKAASIIDALVEASN